MTEVPKAPFALSKPRAAAVVLAMALLVSLASFAWFFSQSMTHNYGDGVARLNIARKVVDNAEESLWQRYIQIGSPWLPLPTVLMLPMIGNDWMWRTGFAGSLLSMLSFILSGIVIYLFARRLFGTETEPYVRALPFLAAAIFVLNPSAVYMQATPMSELPFIASLVTACYLLDRWAERQSWGRLVAAAVALSLGTLVRYEGWPVAALSICFVAFTLRGGAASRVGRALVFAGLTAAGPVYWLWHNRAIYDNALEFLTGPHSARGIYLENQANLGWSGIFVGNAPLDLVLMATTAAVCIGPIILLMALVGLVRMAIGSRRELVRLVPALLLLVPFAFHSASLYRGEIQIFPLSVFGLLNVRYGLPHLTAAAIFAPACVPLLGRFGARRALVIASLLIAGQYAWLISEGPSQLAVYQEGFRNGVNSRPARELRQAGTILRERPPESLVLMHTGALGPLVPRAGMRFSSVIHEGTARWHSVTERLPSDVNTVVCRADDPLHRKLVETPSLFASLQEGFRLDSAAGPILIYRRVPF